jgi:hypothetical protein
MADSKRDYRGGPGQAAAAHPLNGGPVRQPRQPASPQRPLGRRSDQARIAIFGRRHQPHRRAPARRVGGPRRVLPQSLRPTGEWQDPSPGREVTARPGEGLSGLILGRHPVNSALPRPSPACCAIGTASVRRWICRRRFMTASPKDLAPPICKRQSNSSTS